MEEALLCSGCVGRFWVVPCCSSLFWLATACFDLQIYEKQTSCQILSQNEAVSGKFPPGQFPPPGEFPPGSGLGFGLGQFRGNLIGGNSPRGNDQGGNFLSTSETSVTTKCDSFGGLQSVASCIAKLWYFHYKVGQLLESGTTLIIKQGN